MSNPTISKGFTFGNGATVTPTRLNQLVDDATIQCTQTDVVLGRQTSGAGEAEEIPFKGPAREFAAKTTLAAQKQLLGGAAVACATAQFDKTDTTLSDVPGLSLNVAAGETWLFEALISAIVTTAGRGKVAIGGTCTASTFVCQMLYSPPIGGQLFELPFGSALTIGDGVNTTAQCWIRGSITVASDGTLAVRFAQDSASGTSSVRVGSHFKAWQY